MRIVLAILGTYLALFRPLTRYPRHVKREQRLLVGSVEYAYQRAHDSGKRPIAALGWALWAHVGELQPLAVVSKLRADEDCAAQGDEPAQKTWLFGALLVVLAGSGLGVGGPSFSQVIFILSAATAAVSVLRNTWHRGAHWLVLIAGPLLLWPFIDLRGAGTGVQGALALSLMLALGLTFMRTASRDAAPHMSWGHVILFAGVPLVWSLGSVVQGVAETVVARGPVVISASGASSEAPTGAVAWLTAVKVLWTALYLIMVAAIVAAAARRSRREPARR